MTHAKIALIGSTGRVGKMIATGWRKSQSPWSMAPLQTRNTHKPASPTHIPWNIAQGPAPLETWMNVYGPLNCLIVLAGTTPATGQNMGDNITLTERYVDAAEQMGIPRILIASSSAIYGPGVGVPLSETAICAPLNAYGQSKLDMETALQGRSSQKLNICCLRIGNVLGADALLLNAATGRDITLDVFENGHGPQRSYIGPGVMADILGQLACVPNPLPPALNLAAPTALYMDELAHAANLTWTPRLAPNTMIQDLTLDCDLLQALVNLPPLSSDPEQMIEDWKRHRS